MSRSVEAMLDFLSPVSLIPGIGTKRLDAMNLAGIETIGDLLYLFPSKYIDRSTIIPLLELKKFIDQTCTVKGIIERVRIEPGRRPRLRAQLTDESGSVELIWFQGIEFYKNSIKNGKSIVATGKVSLYSRVQMVHPMVEVVDDPAKIIDPFIPRYSIPLEMRSVGIQQKVFSRAIEWVLSKLKHYPRVLPDRLEKKYNFPPLEECIKVIHHPKDSLELGQYRKRIHYEQMYKTAIAIHWNRKKLLLPGRSMSAGLLGDQFRTLLPFKLTEDQENVVSALHKDASLPYRMHRLLQGDVGSGKTLSAFFACLPALNSGFQVAWLAPTEILAIQTFTLLSNWLKQLGFASAFLCSATSASEKRVIYEQLQSGTLKFIVGTHSLLQPAVSFKALGMIVIDEQHKFGVEQRRVLLEKDSSADFLLMSATPIPQTLVQTLYGDLDCVEIRKAPAGRIPVSTHLVPNHKRNDMEKFVIDQIHAGSRVFYVVPRIEHSDDDDEQIMDVETVFRQCSKGAFSSVSTGFIHGKLSSSEKNEIMEKFASGSIDLLVATSLIEVGIDIPDATIIIIENADYFGLAQLHQLRGRVGRGSKKSWCFLLSAADEGSEAHDRLTMFSKNHNGFAIAEMDLKFRGPGQLQGNQQSGWSDSVMMAILDNPLLFKEIQQDIEEILSLSSKPVRPDPDLRNILSQKK